MKKFNSQGGALITTILIAAVMTVVVGAVLALTLHSYRLGKRNEARAKARAIAESELEVIFLHFKSELDKQLSVELLPGKLPDLWDAGTPVATSVRNTYLASSRAGPEGAWLVRRGVSFNQTDHVYGPIPGTSNANGHNYYVVSRVEVIPPASYAALGVPEVHVGRRMVYSVTSILQNSLFYQGDLEMIVGGGDFNIRGDITVNGSLYIGASNNNEVLDDDGNIQVDRTDFHLNLHAKVRATGYFNEDADGNETFFKPGVARTVGADYSRVDPPEFVGAGKAAQWQPMDRPDNFLGGIDPSTAVAARPDLFPSEDDVYRSIIAAPPRLVDDSINTHDYPSADLTKSASGDLDKIGNNRLYNIATVIVTVNGASVTVQTKDDSGTWHDSPALASAVTGGRTLYDEREGRAITVADLDVSALSGLATADWFNGVVYVNQAVGSENSPTAVRLLNGTTTPQRGSNGFTVATNGGVYIQGDYNTAVQNQPCVIVGDAVTVLSANWTDSDAPRPVNDRVASADVTINSAILTGSTAATPDHVSGGAQNLIRYLEKWSGHSVNIYGSLGRLFESKYFTRSYQPPSSGVYSPPVRNIQFDPILAKQNPKGAMSKKNYFRGTFFTY